MRAMPAPAGACQHRGARAEARVSRRGVLGQAGARLRRPGRASAAGRAGARGAWCQPDRRVFTGDGAGGSGDFLMSALHRTGFANIPTSQRADDGLQLRDAYILAAVRCAPPQNKPTPEEIARCQEHLDAEADALPERACGRRARQDCVRRVAAAAEASRRDVSPRPQFGHGSVARCPRRAGVDWLLSPEPAEHEHWKTDAADDGGFVQRARCSTVEAERAE